MIPYSKLPKLTALEQEVLKKLVKNNMWGELYDLPGDTALEGSSCIVCNGCKIAVTNFGLQVYKEYFPKEV